MQYKVQGNSGMWTATTNLCLDSLPKCTKRIHNVMHIFSQQYEHGFSLVGLVLIVLM